MSDVSELLLVLQSPAFHNRRALYIFILRNEAISNGSWRWGAGRQHTTAANVQNRAINSSGQCFGSVPGCHAARARKSGKVLPISVVTQAPKWVAHARARAHNIFRQEYPFHSRRWIKRHAAGDDFIAVLDREEVRLLIGDTATVTSKCESVGLKPEKIKSGALNALLELRHTCEMTNARPPPRPHDTKFARKFSSAF